MCFFFLSCPFETADNSIAGQSDSGETHSTDDVQHSSNLPADQAETKPASVSDAALQDGERNAQPGTPDKPILRPEATFPFFFFPPSAVETLRQLILRDLEEEDWRNVSDDTPTNEAPSQHAPPAAAVLQIAEEREPEEAEQPGFQVVRKGRSGRLPRREI